MNLYLNANTEVYANINVSIPLGHHVNSSIYFGSQVSTSTVSPSTLAQTSSNNTLDYDPNDIKIISFVVWGVLGSILGFLGFLGNMLSMIVLQRRQMRSSTSYYLLSLAIYDNGILIGMMVYFCIPALAHYISGLRDYGSLSNITIPVGYPLSLAAQMGSIYTCVGFTVERFIAVCRPLHAANTCTKSRTVRAIILIFIWSIVYNIPRFFHYQVHYEEDSLKVPSESRLGQDSVVGLNYTGVNVSSTPLPCNDSNLNWTSSLFTHGMSELMESSNTTQSSTASAIPAAAKVQRTKYKETEFGANPTFQHVYLIYSQLFFMFLVPFLIILSMNIGLIKAVKGSKSMQQSMCASARKEHNLTVMLIAVIVVFLVCQFPTIVDNILVAVMGDAKLKQNYAYMCFWTMCTFLVEFNAASNFLLYCFFGKKFRMMLLNILGFKRKQQQVAYRSTVCKSRTNGTRIYEMEVSVM